ncbi:MAG: methyltransferase domain-containing protein [Planctomycetes bacterium]|nr:methyltransferase domain-containing protein [Planctomycetota bacterium]
MSEPFPWSRLVAARRAFRRARGSYWSLGVVRKSEALAAALATPGCRVLDVGAGDRGLERRIRDRVGAVRYESVDPDPERTHDHRSIEAAGGRFDLIACLEVIEHLEPAAALALLAAVRDRLAPGGTLVLSTPNVMNPTAFLTTIDHRTPFAWDELGGILMLLGLRVVRMVRVQNDPWPRRLGRRLLAPLYRTLGIDYARGLAVVAERAETAGGGNGPPFG